MDKKTNETVEVKEKKLTPTERNSADIKELQNNMNDMNNKLDQLLAVLAGQQTASKVDKKVEEAKVEEVKQVSTQPITDINRPLTANDEITIVHLEELGEGLSTAIKLTSMEINLNRMGETITIPKTAADELVGKYRSWFTKGIITFGNDAISIAYAKSKKMLIMNDYEIIKHNMEDLGSLDVYGLEDLYLKVGPTHQENIIAYFKQKVYNAIMTGEKDTNFCDVRKLETLNRLSGCDALKFEIEDLKKIK